MNPPRRRAVLVLGLALSASAAAYVWRPRVRVDANGEAFNLEAMIPSKFGDWHIDDSIPVVLPSPDLIASLATVYNQTLARTYINSRGERIMLSIAYGGDQSDGTSAHWPQSCYPAQGFSITANQTQAIPLADGAKDLPVRRLVAKKDSRNEPISFWIVVGDKVVLSGTEQKLAQLKYGVRGLIPDGMLVRVSSIDRDAAQAYAAHDRFLRDLRVALTPSDLPRVFGAAL